jgi:hypothetical protein
MHSSRRLSDFASWTLIFARNKAQKMSSFIGKEPRASRRVLTSSSYSILLPGKQTKPNRACWYRHSRRHYSEYYPERRSCRGGSDVCIARHYRSCLFSSKECKPLGATHRCHRPVPRLLDDLQMRDATSWRSHWHRSAAVAALVMIERHVKHARGRGPDIQLNLLSRFHNQRCRASVGRGSSTGLQNRFARSHEAQEAFLQACVCA